MAKEKSEKKIDAQNRFGKPLEWLAASVAGIVSGYSTLFNLVGNKFHQDLSNDFGLLEYFRGQKSTETTVHNLQEYAQNFIQERMGRLDFPKMDADKLRASKALIEESKTFIQNLSKSKAGYREFTKKVSHYILEIDSYGLSGATKGVWQRLMTFSPSSRFVMGVKSVAAFGAAFGVTLMAFNQLNTRDKLNEIDKQSERTDLKLDALIEAQHASDNPKVRAAGHIPARGQSHTTTKVAALAAERENSHSAEAAHSATR